MPASHITIFRISVMLHEESSNDGLSVLHQNKTLHNFHERGQHLTAGCKKVLIRA